jgi:hypothetical protein
MVRHRLLFYFTLLLSTACQQNGGSGQVAADRDQSLPLLRAYPPGRWRLDTSEIGNTVLWVSQILIRHAGAAELDPCFSLANWRSSAPASPRSRDIALAFARDLGQQLEQAPQLFAQLAREHSDDVCSRDGGGSLGGLPASALQPFPEVLDALAATPLAAVSRVVETRYGFHLFQRRPPPPEEVVSGAHVVISYDGAGWAKVVGRGELPPRSRTEALAIAQSVYAAARQDPASFPQLVQRHSEHRDALRGGDIGSWSTHEPTDFPREVEVLSRLGVGAVAAPLDSPVGIQVLQRTAARPRTIYATEQLYLGFNPDLPAGQPGSEQGVLALARSAARELQVTPSAFAALQQQYGSVGRAQWADGRGSPLLSSELDQLQLGQISSEPVRVDRAYLILRRVEPVPDQRVTRYELPAPVRPNLALQFARLGADAVAAELAAVVHDTTVQLQLEPSTAERLQRLHQTGILFDRAADASPAAYSAWQREVEDLLGPARYAQYRSLLDAHFERSLLAVTSPG